MAKAILKGMYYEIDKSEIVPERETEKAIAIYVNHEGHKVFMWVPKSQTVKIDGNKIAIQAWVYDRNVRKGKVR